MDMVKYGCLNLLWHHDSSLEPLHTQAKGRAHVVARALRFSSKDRTIAMVCRNLCQAYLLEVGMMQIRANHETLYILYHVGTQIDVSSMINSLGP